MAQCRLQLSHRIKIILCAGLFSLVNVLPSQAQQYHPVRYTQPFVQPFVVPIVSRVGFIRSPSQPLTPEERQFLYCYTTTDNRQVCVAKPVSHILRSR